MSEQTPLNTDTERVHEPRCNTYCTPGTHHLTSGIGFPHLHRTDLAEACGECAPPTNTCTCTDPAVACPSCLARRDRNGWPKDWQERMRDSFCPGCGRAGVVVGLDSVLRETRPKVRPHACGVGGPGSAEIEPEMVQMLLCTDCGHAYPGKPDKPGRWACPECGCDQYKRTRVTPCAWCGVSGGAHGNGCRLGLGPDERGAHLPDCNCAPPYADCGHPACDCTECVYDCPGPCGDHHWLDRPESDTRECLICGTEVAG